MLVEGHVSFCDPWSKSCWTNLRAGATISCWLVQKFHQELQKWLDCSDKLCIKINNTSILYYICDLEASSNFYKPNSWSHGELRDPQWSCSLSALKALHSLFPLFSASYLRQSWKIAWHRLLPSAVTELDPNCWLCRCKQRRRDIDRLSEMG